MTARGKNIRLGDIGEDVKVWQRFLKILETGVFDDAMERAVKHFQIENDLYPSGQLGPIAEKIREEVELHTSPTQPSMPCFSSSVPPRGDSTPPPPNAAA
jgi:putative peptidoglycan binding protein